MIEADDPSDWRDLQRRVCRILTECGMDAEIEREVTTARGQVNVDVVAVDPDPTLPAKYLCECKHWQTAVPKTIVHGSRTVVTDSGANLRIVILLVGFQRGAYDAAEYSNVKLLTWEGFQQLFARRRSAAAATRYARRDFA